MKHPTKHEEKKVWELIEDLSWLFGINQFERTLKFMKSQEKVDASGGGDSAASIDVDRPYQRFTIRIFPAFWSTDRKFQRKCILHEIAHTLPLPLESIIEDLQDGKLRTKQEFIDASEEVVSKMENILDRLLGRRSKWPFKAYQNYLK